MSVYELSEGRLHGPADAKAVEGISNELGVHLPDGYLAFLRDHDGGEGFVGESYVVLWKAEEVCRFNRDYQTAEYAPGVVLFGSDGGGEAYGFDFQSPGVPVVRLPFIGMDRGYAKFVASDFRDFFSSLGVPR